MEQGLIARVQNRVECLENAIKRSLRKKRLENLEQGKGNEGTQEVEQVVVNV